MTSARILIATPFFIIGALLVLLARRVAGGMP
jgi:hypothetical protein